MIHARTCDRITLQLVILMVATAVKRAPTRINSISARNANVWNELLTLNCSARFLQHIMLMTLFFRMCNILVPILVSHHTFIMNHSIDVVVKSTKQTLIKGSYETTKLTCSTKAHSKVLV